MIFLAAERDESRIATLLGRRKETAATKIKFRPLAANDDNPDRENGFKIFSFFASQNEIYLLAVV